QMLDTCNQVVQQSRQYAPGNQLGQEAVQQFTYLTEALFPRQGKLQSIKHERNTNKNDDAADAVNYGCNGWQRKMKLAEIEIDWSFAIHSALTLSIWYRRTGKPAADGWYVRTGVRFIIGNRLVQEGGHQPGSLLYTSAHEDESPIPG